MLWGSSAASRNGALCKVDELIKNLITFQHELRPSVTQLKPGHNLMFKACGYLIVI